MLWVASKFTTCSSVRLLLLPACCPITAICKEGGDDKHAQAPPAGLRFQHRPSLGREDWLSGTGRGLPYLVKLNRRDGDLHGPGRCCQEHLRDTTCTGSTGDTHSLLRRSLDVGAQDSHECLGSLRHVPTGVCPIVSRPA